MTHEHRDDVAYEITHETSTTGATDASHQAHITEFEPPFSLFARAA